MSPWKAPWEALLICGCFLNQILGGFVWPQLPEWIVSLSLDAEALHCCLISIRESRLDLNQNPLILHHCFTPALPPEWTHSKRNCATVVLSWLGTRQGRPAAILQAPARPGLLRVVCARLKPQIQTSHFVLPQPASGSPLQKQLRETLSIAQVLPRLMFLEISSMRSQQQWLSMDPWQVWEMPVRSHLWDREKWKDLRPLHCFTWHQPPCPGFLPGGEKCFSRQGSRLFYTGKKSLGYRWQAQPWMQHFMAVLWKVENITHFTG